MKVIKTKIEGLCVLELEPIQDRRGFFVKVFSEKELKKNKIDFKIREVNQSFNLKKGTIRGMHFQKAPKTEGKIVQCLKGRIFDAVIDLRPQSKTYRQWLTMELSDKNKKMILIPKNFAHGFQILTDQCEVQYFMSEFYSPEHASGLRWNDPAFNIPWPLKVSNISEKDQNWPLLD
ncbi:MAG: dTDP-4-dehydrorhamnose 3,5-epimerase [Candidatus Yanofskybacteria bacterium RIFCSPLOWO2_02_FULL_43_10b]|uniref:dTDP-4-dehydrorhamnose 3,5-epimerase n=1 Tax=Candidatus Yanofskybacteria bacterium RIFCSPLOWO2_02_FULL_43_10b TaxID=1802704 RepID=A0A1F8H6H0_9BACT|nr:MAG: dTDP-4-dehydrorhamnose 3,5-epimerase [Candidatus Yanofskybacteria bacterium RIFCSPLOWO2_02_FULL_43_10b]